MIVVPMTAWWQNEKRQEKLLLSTAEIKLQQIIKIIMAWVKAGDNEDEKELTTREFSVFSPVERYVALAGIILWASQEPPKGGKAPKTQGLQALARLRSPAPVIKVLQELLLKIRSISVPAEARVYQISLNRKASPALEKSVAAVKGDAARQVFQVKCESIGWAVLDSGIDASHDAFSRSGEGEGHRVKAAYDFSNIRKIVSLDNLDEDRLNQHVDDIFNERRPEITKQQARSYLKTLAGDAENDQPIQWELVEKFIKIDALTPPNGGHGTHVIWLYDFRVLSDTLKNTEFAIIAALQFIRFLNNRQSFRKIHGANLSLSIPHDVRNFACGRTPICEECRKLVEDGTVVVAAAGNLGYHSFETKDGIFDGYAAFSITDPGNADDVITVGATHRFSPHTYGVSFFSSRGPTGDGRVKPDLVAPGERILSCLPGNDWGALDGTSMAAPHVSGAAAMLMARYSELIGRPRRIKALLCETATDLGRERTFQGHGMLDILRAFQKT
ncbi:MAG: hypothetical protein B7Z47_00845 [Chthoniobacter sp. 12-60-6]|nr:MAG: hypothetical protein B7Z47_00845 [Chthoniobacter sp. 12-60-6]